MALRGQALDKWCKWSLSHTNLPFEALCSLNLGRAYRDTLLYVRYHNCAFHPLRDCRRRGYASYIPNQPSCGSLCWSEPITGHAWAVDTPERCDSWTNCGALAGIRGASLCARGNKSRSPDRLHTVFDLEGISFVLKVRERYQERCCRRHYGVRGAEIHPITEYGVIPTSSLILTRNTVNGSALRWLGELIH